MAKTRKTLILLLTMFCLLWAAILPVGAAGETKQVSLRVEGVNACLYSGTLTLPADATAADALLAAEGLTVEGLDEGYITAINGEKAAQFGGWDGWMYVMNGEVPTVGMTDLTPADGDALVVYYGDYPCQLPLMDTSKLNSDGVLIFTANDTVYDANFNASTVVNPVTGATVTVDGKSYVTDDKGAVRLDLTNGTYTVQIEKKAASGAPAVLRFAADTKVTVDRATAAVTTTTAAVTTAPATVAPPTGEAGSSMAAVLLFGAAGVLLLTTAKRRV